MRGALPRVQRVLGMHLLLVLSLGMAGASVGMVTSGRRAQPVSNDPRSRSVRVPSCRRYGWSSSSSRYRRSQGPCAGVETVTGLRLVGRRLRPQLLFSADGRDVAPHLEVGASGRT